MRILHPLTAAVPRQPWHVRQGGSTGCVGSYGWSRTRWDEALQVRAPQFHRGVDFLAPAGTPVYACFDGKVSMAGEQQGGKGFGQRIYLKAADGKMQAIYAHLSVQFVKVGQVVRAGHCLGLTGRSGNLEDDCPDHLHFEMREGESRETAVNPEWVLHKIGNKQGIPPPGSA